MNDFSVNLKNVNRTMYRVSSYESNASGVSASSTELAFAQECKEAFDAARTIEDLQRLTVAFLHGEMAATSYHFGPLLTESVPLVDRLVRLNGMGFITTSSQPGGRERTQLQTVEKRFYVEGILPKRLLALFIQQMYRRCSDYVFIALPEQERTYEEVQDLQAADQYWVTRDANTHTGLLHITELNGPCRMFQTCDEIYPLLADEYVTLFIMDTRWGYQGAEVLDAAITSLHALTTRLVQMRKSP